MKSKPKFTLVALPILISLTLIVCPSRCLSDNDLELRVLSFNVWRGGDRAEADAIAASNADIVGIQEGDESTATMAGLLGFNHHILANSQGGSSNGIITRFDIIETFDNGVKLNMDQLGDGYVFSVHLAASPYQPYQLHPKADEFDYGPRINTGTMKGDADAAVASAAAARAMDIDRVLEEIAAAVPDGATVFLVGDFNEPSHLDWTESAGPNGARLHSHVVTWPTSSSVVDAGFVDSFRQMHPDEVSRPGMTWTTLDNDPEVHDRIDFVYFKSDTLTLVDAQLVGDTGMAGGVSSDIALVNYPSDHRAALSTFRVVPEPSNLLLVTLAATGLWFWKRT